MFVPLPLVLGGQVNSQAAVCSKAHLADTALGPFHGQVLGDAPWGTLQVQGSLQVRPSRLYALLGFQ